MELEAPWLAELHIHTLALSFLISCCSFVVVQKCFIPVKNVITWAILMASLREILIDSQFSLEDHIISLVMLSMTVLTTTIDSHEYVSPQFEGFSLGTLCAW
jgi:hypothetical protein